MTRRLPALAAVLLLALGLAACSDDPTAGEIDSPSQEQQEQTIPGGDGEEGEADPQNLDAETGENEIDGEAPIGEDDGDSDG